MGRRILNRKDLRADFEAAERTKGEDEEVDEEEEESDEEEEEAEAGEEAGEGEEVEADEEEDGDPEFGSEEASGKARSEYTPRRGPHHPSHTALSTIHATSSSNLIPAWPAISGTSEVGVIPGCVFNSSR